MSTKPKSIKKKSKKIDQTKSLPNFRADSANSPRKSELLADVAYLNANSKDQPKLPQESEVGGDSGRDSSQLTDWTANHFKKPKQVSEAGFDIGFPIDTYISAAYIFASLSQTEEGDTKKKTRTSNFATVSQSKLTRTESSSSDVDLWDWEVKKMK